MLGCRGFVCNKKIKDMPKHGIIVYSVEKNGCLNGRYTNEDQDGVLYNEILRKEIKNTLDSDETLHPLCGEYKAMYFDNGNSEIQCDVTISRVNAEGKKTNGTFFLEWVDKESKGAYLRGIGYLISDRELVVAYTD